MEYKFGEYRGLVPKGIEDAISKNRELFDQIVVVYMMGWRMCLVCKHMTAKCHYDLDGICPQCKGLPPHDYVPESGQYGAVYVARLVDLEGDLEQGTIRIKIGATLDSVEARIKSHRKRYGRTIFEFCYETENPFSIEQTIQNYFREYRVSKRLGLGIEVFDIPEEALEEIDQLRAVRERGLTRQFSMWSK